MISDLKIGRCIHKMIRFNEIIKLSHTQLIDNYSQKKKLIDNYYGLVEENIS